MQEEDIICFLLSSWNSLRLFFSSESFLDLLIAAVGSFFGAAGGYVIVVLVDAKRRKQEQVQNYKGAFVNAHALFQLFCNLKTSILDPIINTYKSNKKTFQDLHDKSLGELSLYHNSNIIIDDVPFDYRSAKFPFISVENLNNVFFEKLGATSKIFFIATTLLRSIEQIKDNFNIRENLFQLICRESNEQRVQLCLYYGLQFDLDGNKIQDSRFSDIINALEEDINDCIWFSKELTTDLIKEAKDEYGVVIGHVNYEDVPSGIIPDDSKYKDWREKFIKLDNSKFGKVKKFLQKLHGILRLKAKK